MTKTSSRFAFIVVWITVFHTGHFASGADETQVAKSSQPNIVFLLTDDQRWDTLSAAGNDLIQTPNLDRIANNGVRFENAFVTLAICSPSRAACLTGRYGSANGVTSVGKTPLNPGETTFANALKAKGYVTGVAGKWHLSTTPAECGFDFASTCWSNGTWYDRKFTVDGETKIMPGFVDDVAADESIRFINQSVAQDKPFVLWMCTQVPHMDSRLTWPAKDEFLNRRIADQLPLPKTWNEDLAGKPVYLLTSRNRTQAQKYGYADPNAIRSHARDYYASVEQMDAAVGRVLDDLKKRGLDKNTWVIFMGDNGWMLGEHGMTSKVLPYEESMRVPMAISGPSLKKGVCDKIVLNIDLTATIYELAGLPVPKRLHGHSLLPILNNMQTPGWRTSFLYEAPTPQLGSQPLWAVRDKDWKYVETQIEDGVFRELYDLRSDAIELQNVADETQHRDRLKTMAQTLKQEKKELRAVTLVADQNIKKKKATISPAIPKTPPKQPRTDLFISGVYPHLTTYGVYSQNGAHYKSGHNECGIGAIVPWADKLWMVNYAPHMPKGSEHKLFSIDSDLNQPMTVHPESVGGTPAGRMIHAESQQLLIAHHLIDANGKVRTISPKDMPIRVTAITRHLTDPANMVYYVDMEGSIWEANVHTLAVKQLFKKPVPGWHGKGAYVSQGRLVLSNNGELHVGSYKDVLVGGSAKNKEERGVLAEYDGKQWRIIERRQFTEVTGPQGITGGSDGDDPIWTMGWDRRSVRLKVLDNGKWHTYLLPKAAYCNDASHGWYTEWPRIREITDGRWMMDMHGMFYDFPKTFSASNSAGIRPIGSHLRYVPDFCGWNGRLVLATDETSIQGNELAGQPQSNLWFGKYDDLKTWGPATAYGGPWIEDSVSANVPSAPFLVAGFDKRIVHLATGRKKPVRGKALRATDQLEITSMPTELVGLPRVTIPRGNWKKPAPGFEFTVDQPVTVYLAADQRGNPRLHASWKRTELTMRWGKGFTDTIYQRDFKPGEIVVPGNAIEHTPGSFGMPHAAFVRAKSAPVAIVGNANAAVTLPKKTAAAESDQDVTFTLQVDRSGTNEWTDLETITLPADGYATHILPADLNAIWLRFKADRDCVATAFLHQSAANLADGTSPANKRIFDALADVNDSEVLDGLLYAAKRNRDLRVITADERYFDFERADFQFRQQDRDKEMKSLLHVEPEFTVDDASVILKSNGVRYRLPKGPKRFDRPFASGWPRSSREVESERHLANIHGTFYEIPLITNGAPPAWNLMRPVSSHAKQITDFCSWNGLLVLSGIRPDAKNDGHAFVDPKQNVGLWFGAIDDLWKLGKPTGKGGPWKNTSVRAGQTSDPYLMTGYDKKQVELSHQSNNPVSFNLQVDFNGKGLWADYRTIQVGSGETHQFKFPDGFSAFWIRAAIDNDTKATMMFEYQ